MRKGNLTVAMIFDLDKEDQIFNAILQKLQELKAANKIDSATMSSSEVPYARTATV